MPKLKALEQLRTWRERYPAPCQAACPVHTDVRSYVTLVGEGRFDEAFRAARGPNPLAAICGRACSAPCEDVCTRAEIDAPLKIRKLKRFLTDRFDATPGASVQAPPTGLRVAVIGAGPAGLAAAHDLALLGHGVTVFEAAPEAGGMALLGVPRFRLAAAAISQDVAAVRALGVEVRTGVRVGADIAFSDLQRDFAAVFIAAGATRLTGIDIEGVGLQGVLQALPFLETANLGGRPACGARVAVLGGGYTAMDAARTALRLGAENVTVLYRRTRHESEVHEEELDETLREGVRIEYLVSPLCVVDDGHGRVAGIGCIRNALGEPDASGRARPVPIAGSEFTWACDTVILALGQSPDLRAVAGDDALALVDPQTLMTAIPGVFSGGDCVSGSSTIIEAVAAGRQAAGTIHRYLHDRFAPAAAWPLALDAWPLEVREALPGPGLNGHGEGLSLVREVEQTLSRREAMADGLRCLLCGLLPYIEVDACTACQACELVCPTTAIHRVALSPSGERAEVTGDRDVLAYHVTAGDCIRCGRCFGACPTGAIVAV